jgi:hypothetical protein
VAVSAASVFGVPRGGQTDVILVMHVIHAVNRIVARTVRIVYSARVIPDVKLRGVGPE